MAKYFVHLVVGTFLCYYSYPTLSQTWPAVITLFVDTRDPPDPRMLSALMTFTWWGNSPGLTSSQPGGTFCFLNIGNSFFPEQKAKDASMTIWEDIKKKKCRFGENVTIGGEGVREIIEFSSFTNDERNFIIYKWWKT